MKKNRCLFLFVFMITSCCKLFSMEGAIAQQGRLLAEAKAKNAQKKEQTLAQMCKKRRLALVEKIKAKYPEVKEFLIVFFAALEDQYVLFRQESTFYYFTGISDGDSVVAIDQNSKSHLFIPNCVEEKKKWEGDAIEATGDFEKMLEFETIEFLGERFYDNSDKLRYANLTCKIEEVVSKDGKVFVLDPNDDAKCFWPQFFLRKIKSFFSVLTDECCVDISSIVAKMRRKKEPFEIKKIINAIKLSHKAHCKAAKKIKDGVFERKAQAAIEYVFTKGGAVTAYRTIAPSGKSATILHYTKNAARMKNGQLILIDAGAKLDNYCADITRTYPVSGTFTERQKELYNIVLGTQCFIASVAKVGDFLINKQNVDKSLFHLAKRFLQKMGGYDKYFSHGIGHYLGLDVHDVGDPGDPLEEGDVITIEPGVYIPEEEVGIRIEDNYLITKEGAVCLSSMIPKKAEEIEALMKAQKQSKKEKQRRL